MMDILGLVQKNKLISAWFY